MFLLPVLALKNIFKSEIKTQLILIGDNHSSAFEQPAPEMKVLLCYTVFVYLH